MVDGQERKRDQDVKEIVEILLSSGADPNIQDKVCCKFLDGKLEATFSTGIA